MAARRAAAAGMRSLQVFSAKPQFYNDKISVKPERAQRFREALAETGIGGEHCLVHAAYVLNTASPEADKYERAAAGLAKELERTTQLSAFAFCFHPGSAGSSDPAGAVARCGDAITRALESVPGRARVLIENTAGAGTTMARTAQEVGMILAHIPKRYRARTGYGLDTCHLFASGYDIRKRDELTRTLDLFEAEAGEKPGFFHLNDSEGALGSNKDRHVLIGDGHIGIEPFQWLVEDPRSRGIPMILETPQQNYEIGEDDDSPDPYDLRMVELLRSFAS